VPLRRAPRTFNLVIRATDALIRFAAGVACISLTVAVGYPAIISRIALLHGVVGSSIFRVPRRDGKPVLAARVGVL
jgi:hypothetical protein